MNTYLIKIALSAVPAPKDKSKEPTLRPHTRRALAKLERTGGLLVDHSMGSGKTLLYLKAIEAYQKKDPKEDTLFLAPASLTTNVDKEIKKHGVKIDVSKLNVMSYEKAAIAAEKLRKNKYGMVVADEAHKLRNTGTKRHQELSDIISRAERRLLGTGTTAYNHVSDIAPLVNLAAGNPVLPEGKKAFEEKFVSKKTEQPPLLKRIMGSPAKEVHNLKGKRELSDVLRQYVDHYDLKDDPSAKDKFPTRTDKIIEVEMSPQQKALYGYMEDKLPFHLKLKVRMNMALDKRDTAQLQAFSSGIRQVSNSLKPFMPKHQDTTPKMIAAAESMHASYKADKKNFRGIAYSNYLGAGLQEYSDELKKRGVKHGLYHGGLSKTQKDQLVEDYNSGKVPVLVVSSSGTEGLNLKGTRKAQVLEPHFNKSKIDQFAARAIRFESHEHLPKAERTVEVEHYLSTLPKKRFQFGPKQHSIDQYLHHNSETKNRLGEQMKDLVKQAEVVLVKEALNAFKARVMAKKVGIIADHTTQWKYGLRKLRDSKGIPLLGDSLEKAKSSMGAMHPKDFSKILKYQAKNPNKEIGFAINNKTNRVDYHSKGVSDTVEIGIDPKTHRGGHTHPDEKGYVGFFKGPRIAHASGLSEHELPFKSRSSQQAFDEYNAFRKSKQILGNTDSLEKHVLQKNVRGIVGHIDLDTNQVVQGGLRNSGTDVATGIRLGKPNQDSISGTYNIVSPEHKIDAVHKSTGTILSNGRVLATKHRTVMFKQAFATVDYTFPRAKYKESESFDHIKDPVASLKRDGAAFFMEIGTDGSPKYYSRRESVKGGFPDRSEKLPHLSDNKLLDHIGNVYHVELYHTGHDASELAKDSHPAVSGILNSLPAKAIETQTRTGPVRAMLLDVISPKINTYGEKLEHMKQVANAFGKTEVLRAPDTKIGKAEIEQLIKDTKARADEGIIITSLTAPEDKNTRIKVKHVDTYNLRVVDINQEYDILGNPKESMGALVVVDRSGRIVCNVGTGFTREQRIEIWKNKENWIGKLIQVKAMPSAAHRLRAPVYNGLADGEIDNVSTWLK